MIQNVWHDIDYGKDFPKKVNAIIEIPKDTQVKYELDKETGLLKLDRFLYSSVHYPGDYGLIPRTLWDDNDPMDIIILTNKPVFPLTLAQARVIGVISMIDDGENDEKIIAVYEGDPRYEEYQDLTDLPKHMILELKNFFEIYKELQGKRAIIPHILGKKEAYKTLEKAKKIYEEKFGKK
ncbi:MAG: inorganic diphosphatase [Nanoarchaeota archaeon]